MGSVFLDGRLIVKTGDITAERVDVVVNAANSGLMGGGGVDGAIHAVGGPAILEECRQVRRTQYPDGLPAGTAVATAAGDLPARWVIHTVGPVWHGGGRNEPALLAACYRNSLNLAVELGARTATFPAISTGVYGYPREAAAVVALESLRGALADHAGIMVTLVFFSAEAEQAFLKATAVLR
ncbi:MAG: O-acetyl-ADP-ribose deacetylase [Planctomycetota bacterium]